jgi:hypothetical protein
MISNIWEKIKADVACSFKNPIKTGQWILTLGYVFFLGLAFDPGGFDPDTTLIGSSAAVYGGLMTALNAKRRERKEE